MGRSPLFAGGVPTIAKILLMTGTGSSDSEHLYTARFFQVFAALMLFMTGVALQYHFGQYIAFLGYGVDTLGRILSISMVGTLLIRLQLGRWIDRFGCRPTWMVGTMTMALAVGTIQFTAQLWLIVVLRAVSTMAMAAVMTTVAVFAAQMAPVERRTESIGTMGLAGFLGMMVGSTLGDWIFSGTAESMTSYRIFFSASATCGVLSGGIVLFLKPWALIGPNALPQARIAPLTMPVTATMRVILRHWPGMILLTGVVFSMVFCLQLTFLERLADERGFKDIKVFFLVYGPTAITLRIICRRVPEQLGRTRALLGGLLLMAIGVGGLVGTQSQGQLVLPALLMGAGHCFVFPSMIDLAASRLPPEYRGVGTSLILAAGDLGILTGFFTLGELIDRFGFDRALEVLVVILLSAAGLVAYTRRRTVFFRGRPYLHARP